MPCSDRVTARHQRAIRAAQARTSNYTPHLLATQTLNPAPDAAGVWVIADAGRRLADLHIAYEALEPWPLKWIETPNEPLSYVVEKMKLTKDK